MNYSLNYALPIWYINEMKPTKRTKNKRSEGVDSRVFVDRVRILMEQKGLTSSGLADKSDIARSAVTQLFAGNRKPSVDALAKIAGVLDVSTDYLLGVSDTSELSDLLQHGKILEVAILL